MEVRSNIPEKAKEYLDEQFKKAEAAVYKAMVKTGLVGEKRVKTIVSKEAYDTGRLLRSVTSIIERSPNELKLIIGTNLDYAIFVEEGRKPGKFPNLNSLVKWVGRKLREKGINARVNVTFDELKAMAKQKTVKGGYNAQAKIARQHLSAVYLIGRKIATKGIREKYIFKRLEAGLLAYFRQEAQKELESIQ